MERLEEEDQAMQEIAEKGARAAGMPMISFFTPDQILYLAHQAGFKVANSQSTKDLEQLYFSVRADGLLPASGEVFLTAIIFQ